MASGSTTVADTVGEESEDLLGESPVQRQMEKWQANLQMPPGAQLSYVVYSAEASLLTR